MRSSYWLTLAVIATASQAWAVTLDGVLDAPTYGSPLAVQKVQTQFGNADIGMVQWANGSELDAAYAKIDGGSLFLFFAGNLETNYNKLEIFFDVGQAGQSQLRRDNVDVNFNALARMGENLDGTNLAGNDPNKPANDPSQPSQILGAGLKFDAGFQSNFYMTVGAGWNDTDQDFRMYADFASTPEAGNGTGFFVGGSTSANNRLITGANGVNVAIDNSNTGGVAFGVMPIGSSETPAAVTTGLEIEIPLALLGSPTGDIRVTSFINGSSHNFLSNQVLGALEPDPVNGIGNLAEPRTVDFSTLAGDQFFTIEQTAALLAGDYNADGFVGTGDLNLVLSSWGQNVTAGDKLQGDGSGDGFVGTADLNQILSDWGQGAAPAPAEVSAMLAAVPEPASLSLLGLAGLGLLGRRRRRGYGA